MNADEFLKSPFETAEEWEENEDALQMYRDYRKTPINKLIIFFGNTYEKKEEVDGKLRLRVLKEIIAWRLGIPLFEYFVDTLNERFQILESEIKKLKRFKEHRHKTIMGLYTERAVY